MRIILAIPGKIKNQELKTLISYYSKLTNRFTNTEVIELGKKSENQISEWLEKLGSRIYLTVLDEKGSFLNSTEISKKCSQIIDRSHTHWIILCGSEHGYSFEIKKKAKWIWSLSPMIMPHELAATVAMEQIYRSYTILYKHPYHNS